MPQVNQFYFKRDVGLEVCQANAVIVFYREGIQTDHTILKSGDCGRIQFLQRKHVRERVKENDLYTPHVNYS